MKWVNCRIYIFGKIIAFKFAGISRFPMTAGIPALWLPFVATTGKNPTKCRYLHGHMTPFVFFCTTRVRTDWHNPTFTPLVAIKWIQLYIPDVKFGANCKMAPKYRVKRFTHSRPFCCIQTCADWQIKTNLYRTKSEVAWLKSYRFLVLLHACGHLRHGAVDGRVLVQVGQILAAVDGQRFESVQRPRPERQFTHFTL